MRFGETPRQAAERRIAEQEARVARQRDLLAILASNGAGTDTASRLLKTMEDTLTALRTSLSQYSN